MVTWTPQLERGKIIEGRPLANIVRVEIKLGKYYYKIEPDGIGYYYDVAGLKHSGIPWVDLFMEADFTW